jgi:hypothetical protein
MNKHEIKENWRVLNYALKSFDDHFGSGLYKDAMTAAIKFKEVADAHVGDKPDCRCQHGQKLSGNLWWMLSPREMLKNFNTRAVATPVTLSFCPECGRKI